MTNPNSEDVINLSHQLHLPEETTQMLLAEHVYNDAKAWKKFLRLFFLTVGIGMLCAGIIMFFAYNWNAIHKFAKFAMLEGLIVISILLVLFAKVKDDVRNLMLTGATLMTGALFAVFGQIYQTGANAYDFFMGWTLAVTLWVLVAGFAPLWLIYIILVNTTVVLYFGQVVVNESAVDLYALLFGINLLFVLTLGLFSNKTSIIRLPRWFFNLVAGAAAFCATIGIIAGIFGEQSSFLVILLISTAVVYSYGVRYSLKEKRSFYLSLVAFSMIVIICAGILNIGFDAGGWLLAFVFLVLAITGTIKMLINLQKKWALE